MSPLEVWQSGLLPRGPSVVGQRRGGACGQFEGNLDVGVQGPEPMPARSAERSQQDSDRALTCGYGG
ncbi:hypothetical protein, partial [Mycobacterium sp.]|uniref:hypothetical protein n=1 Tax=Mycobacterium sp. TaxID=1785 RepID=UPI002B5DB42D